MTEPRRIPVFISILLLPILLPAMLIGAATSIPYSRIVRLQMRRRENAFLALMKSRERVIHWSDFSQAVSESRGTVLAERAYKGLNRWWWTPDNVRELSPFPIAGWWTMVTDKSFEPFSNWCRDRYTSPETGRAMIVRKEPELAEVARTLWFEHHSSEPTWPGKSISERWIDVVPPEVFRRKTFK
jgi:hypothetical protein